MTRTSLSVAVILPSIFAAIVIGLLLGSVILEGPPDREKLAEQEALHAKLVASLSWVG